MCLCKGEVAIGSRWVLNPMARVNALNYEFQGHGERLEQLSFWKKLPIRLQTENVVCD